MKGFFKVFAISMCMLLCLCAFIGCSDDVTMGDEDAAKSEIFGERQEAVDGKMAVPYLVINEDRESYDSFKLFVYYGEALMSECDIDPERNAVVVDAVYGKSTVKLVATKDDKAEVLASAEMEIYADEYNFATLNATFPVVYFTLDMFSMGEESAPGAFAEAGGLPIMKDVPTFVSLERHAAYSWENLPENVFTLPGGEAKGDFHKNNTEMARYIKELYDINPDSKFNFYCTDNYPELILKMFTAQQIPEKNFHATMISDGTGTFVIYRSIFSPVNAEEEYTKMVAEWERVKAAAANGEKDYLKDVYNRYHDTYSVLATYAFLVAAEEDNVDIWCSRDLFTSNTESEFIKGVVADMIEAGKIKMFGINNMLSILHTEEQIALKKLFHFDAEMFEAAEAAGKKALVIIGSSPAAENGELEAYVKLLQAIYGDEYMLYYKGHPRYPVELDDDKNAMFEKYGLINLDASIAAELIMFYSPEIELVGWGSTTFKSAAEGKFLALFNYTKAEGKEYAEQQGYPDMPDTYYKTIVIGEKAYIVVEYNDNDTVKYFDVEAGDFVSALPIT